MPSQIVHAAHGCDSSEPHCTHFHLVLDGLSSTTALCSIVVGLSNNHSTARQKKFCSHQCVARRSCESIFSELGTGRNNANRFLHTIVVNKNVAVIPPSIAAAYDSSTVKKASFFKSNSRQSRQAKSEQCATACVWDKRTSNIKRCSN